VNPDSIPNDGNFHVIAGDEVSGMEIAIARNGNQVMLRHAADHSKTLRFTGRAWQAFIQGLKNGEF
jgi:hypothetical protein